MPVTRSHRNHGPSGLLTSAIESVVLLSNRAAWRGRSYALAIVAIALFGTGEFDDLHTTEAGFAVRLARL